jgi:mono/diheme cytochrome c family protein
VSPLDTLHPVVEHRMLLVPMSLHPATQPIAVAACVVALAGCASTRPNASTWLAAREAVPPAARIYDRECASCHGTSGDGTRGIPPLVGDGALPFERDNRRAFKTARDLYDYVSTTMPLPPKKIGTLPSDEYWLVVELLVRTRGVDVPHAGLSMGNADAIELE